MHDGDLSLRRISLSSLNHDVFKYIADFCEPLDALHLALTCKLAYELAHPRLLSDVAIGDPGEDDGPDRLKQFCDAMLSNPAHLKHLRALRLLDGAFASSSNSGPRSGWGADFSSADVLTKLLLEASNLRVVHIRDAEPLFQSHPHVYEAIAKLPSLRELSLYYIGNSSLKAMSQLVGRPAVIENGLWKDGPRPQGDITPFGPYVDSLRHLKLWECGCMLESIIDRHVWPNVHTLDIGGRIAKISELARAFPRLRRLTFYREFSVKQEAAGPAPCWPGLDYLETSAPLPSFPSPARRLQLQYPIGTKAGTQNDLKTLPLMERANPVVLSCTIAHQVPDALLRRMKAVMPALRYVEVMLNDGTYGRTMTPQEVQEWVELNLAIMRPAPYTAVLVGYAGDGGGLAALSDTRRRELERVARTIARGFDKVEYVGVGLHRPREGASIHHPREDGQYECEALWFAVEGRPQPSAREGAAQGEGKGEGEGEGESDGDADADGEEGPTLVPVPQADCQALRERLLEMPRA